MENTPSPLEREIANTVYFETPSPYTNVLPVKRTVWKVQVNKGLDVVSKVTRYGLDGPGIESR